MGEFVVKGLRSADLFSPSDPYIQIQIKGHLFDKEKKVGKVIWDNNNPIFNEEFVLHPHKQNDIVLINLWDKDKITKDDFLGKVELPVAQYLNRGVTDEWRPLLGKDKKPAGEIHLVIRYGQAFGHSQYVNPPMFPAPKPNQQFAPQQAAPYSQPFPKPQAPYPQQQVPYQQALYPQQQVPHQQQVPYPQQGSYPINPLYPPQGYPPQPYRNG